MVRKGFVGPLKDNKPNGPDSEHCIVCKAPLLMNN